MAQSIYDQIDPEVVVESQAGVATGDSAGQRRIAPSERARLGSDARVLEIHPNPRAGFGLVRAGAGTAMVGSHGEVAEPMATYHELSIEEFALSGCPHLEEAYWVR